MKNVIIVCLFILVSAGKEAKAQFSIGDDSLLKQKITFQVKQISEFFDRFNFKDSLKLNDNNYVSRRWNLVSLVNQQDTGLLHNKNIFKFINYVSDTANHILLSYEDSNWYSTAHCTFIFHNKPFSIDIILKMEGERKTGYNWVITNVRGEVFRFKTKTDDSSEAFINPMNHEIGFSELAKALRQKNKLPYYVSSHFKPNPLTMFISMVQNGDITLKQIESVDFQFFQIPDWAFEVKDFNRSNFNSGWLISSIKKVTETEKNNYINSILNN